MTGDRDFIYPLGVAIASLARHCSVPLHLDYALPRDWPQMVGDSDLALVSELVTSLGWTIDLVECPIEATVLPRTRHISSMTFMKPAYFDIATAPQVAFIDGDLIAVADWTDLLAPMEPPFAIEAAREDNMHDFELQWNPSEPAGWYLNAGVLKANPALWQREYTQKWRGLLAEYDRHDFVYLEQDLMNAALLGRAGHIAPELNCRPAYGHQLDGASIVHYAGWWKPWLTVASETRRLTPELQRSYRMYLDAEAGLLRHVREVIGPSAERRWKQERRRPRGRGDWRAHYRYRRWALAQQVHRLRGH